MTGAQYDRERAELLATYGQNASEANGRREQEWAKLFYRSGWQEELAKKEGKSQQHIARRVLFGRFLNLHHDGVNPESLPANLTQRRFRSYWDRTDKTNKEHTRFKAPRALRASLMRLDLAAPVK
jgi:hypothetical protein